MSKITQGQITLTVINSDDEEEELTLKPTLKAGTQISNRFGGYLPCIQALSKLDLQAAVYVVQLGIGAKDAEAKALPDKVFRAGIKEVAPKCMEFVRILMNGGKDDEEDEGTAGKAVA